MSLNRKCYLGGCEDTATCVGRYEGRGPVKFVCDVHCGHSNEDGWCVPVERAAQELAARLGAAYSELTALCAAGEVYVKRWRACAANVDLGGYDAREAYEECQLVLSVLIGAPTRLAAGRCAAKAASES